MEDKTTAQSVHVYVFELDNNTVKIGISENIRRRIKEIQGGGNNVLRFAVSQRGFKKSEARSIESACHRYFKNCRKPKQHEYFYVSYDEANEYLQTHTPVIEPHGDDLM